MTDDNSNIDENNVDIDTDDLDAFSDEYFGIERDIAISKADAAEEDEEVDDQNLGEDDDPPAPEEDEEAEPEKEEDEKPEPKGKKNTFQERINELTAKAREAERREANLQRELEQLKAAVNKDEKKEEPTKPTRDISMLDDAAPQPDELDENGDPVYPLGEFDPKFIQALTKYTIDKLTAEREAEDKAKAEAKAQEEFQEALKADWQDKLTRVETEIPDIRENITKLVDVFADLDDNYGQYLATTLMASDYGPEIMNYFSLNIGEAQKIVASGPAAATLAIGRLEARFEKQTSAEDTEKKGNKKVSNAQEPPPMNRGANGRFAVAPDTDDLEAFEKEFFKRR